MDEQRIQAYVELIQQLLGCPQGEEGDLLQANAELVDAGLVAVMGQVADWIEGQGDSNVGWLRQFAGQLAQALGLEAGSPSGAASGDASGFMVEIVQLIAQTEGDQAQVYGFFRDNVNRLDEALLEALPEVFANLIQQNDPGLIAAVFGAFGNLIQQFPLGRRWLNLEMGIAAYQKSLTVRTQAAMPVDWATTMMNLATAYYSRIRGDKADNLEQAIAAYEQAVTVTTKAAMPFEWAQTTMNLAAAYCDRIKGDRAENIEQAIDFYEQALSVMTQEAMPIEWAQTTMNLATAYCDRIKGDRAENIEQAIKAYNQALTVRTKAAMPIEWATTTDNLATAYTDRIKGDRAENIEQAIKAYNQALTVRTKAAMPIKWAQTTMNLANAYCDRIKGDRSENIEAAINAYQQALTVMTQAAMPIDWAQTTMNLATAYADRIKGDRSENIEAAINAYEQALTVRTLALPDDCRKTGRLLANLYSDQTRWTDAVRTYDLALEAAEICYQRSDFLDSKASELSTTADLPRRAAYAYAKTGDLPKAIETLEQGRARGLSESLDRDRTNLDNLKAQNEPLYTQYKGITQQLRNLEAQQRDRMTSSDRHSITPEALRNEATRLRQELTETIDQIRQQKGYATFLTLPTFKDVQKAVTSDSPLTYLLTTPAGSLALVVTPNDIHPHPIWLNDFTYTQLTDLLNNTWFNNYQKWVEASRRFQANQSAENRRAKKQAEDDWLEAIDTTTNQLWDLLMGPIVQKLQDLGFQQTTLIPTGYLSLLPLHAAWVEDPSKPNGRRYALDDLHITYAPNAKFLTAAGAIAERVQATSLLAINNPTQDLANTEIEIQAVIAHFSNPTVLKHGEATVEQVKSKLPGATIAHFSCHGTANLTEPLTSGLAMSDGLLTLKDIFALNLAESGGLRLAILSACETGMIGIENADEAISLPTGLLQAGVAAVIASLWSVDDLSTMMLLTRFYDLWRIDGLEIDQALRQAQQWVRDTTNKQKYDYLKDAFQKLVNTQQISAQEVNDLLGEFMRRYTYPDGPQGKSFAHPFHWAAFNYTGV